MKITKEYTFHSGSIRLSFDFFEGTEVSVYDNNGHRSTKAVSSHLSPIRVMALMLADAHQELNEIKKKNAQHETN